MLLAREIILWVAGANQYLLEEILSALAIHRHLGNQKQVTEQERHTTYTKIKTRLREFSEIISRLHKSVEEVTYSDS